MSLGKAEKGKANNSSSDFFASKLDCTYGKIIEHLQRIFDLLKLKRNHRKPFDWPLATLALTKGVYYRESCLKIDWRLLRKYQWTYCTLDGHPPRVTDAQFSDIQYCFLMMRSLGEEFVLYFLRGYRHLTTQWLMRCGFAMALRVVLIALPIMVVSVYPSILKLPIDTSISGGNETFGWQLLFEKAQQARLTILDVFVAISTFPNCKEIFQSFEQQNIFFYLNKAYSSFYQSTATLHND